MPRWIIAAVAFVALFFGIVYVGLPALKRAFIGSSLQVQVQILSAEDDYDVRTPSGISVSKTVVNMVVEFPMGSAPDNPDGLKVTGKDGKAVEVLWTMPEKEDDDEKGVTRWTFRDPGVFFPIGFREGMLATEHRDLKYFRLTGVSTRDAVEK